jgi:hypothetical protein
VALGTYEDAILEDGGTADAVLVDVVDSRVAVGHCAATGRILALSTVTDPDDLFFEAVEQALRIQRFEGNFWVNLLEEEGVARPDYLSRVGTGTAKQNDEATVMWEGLPFPLLYNKCQSSLLTQRRSVALVQQV